MAQKFLIQKLSDEIINQIKAGEVVEKPSNIVKELVENSLDAGAKEINIELLDGGKQLIRVSDDGFGIPSHSLLLALERHATSKITQFEDLYSLGSFGFRGEALPSIAAVSQFSIRSRTENEKMAREIHVNHGKLVSDDEVYMSTTGTVVQVKDLFSEVPVRLKFLKATSTEFSHVSDFIMAIALANEKVGFQLMHNGRKCFSFPKNQSQKDRLVAALGKEAESFIPVHFERGEFSITGFAGLPSQAKPFSKQFITFVNGRYVRDKVVRSGVLQAYSGYLIKGLMPSAIIFISISPRMLDVNAHPSKIEVRFTDPMLVQDYIVQALQDALRKEIQNSTFSQAHPFINPAHSPKSNILSTPPNSRPSIESLSLGKSQSFQAVWDNDKSSSPQSKSQQTLFPTSQLPPAKISHSRETLHKSGEGYLFRKDPAFQNGENFKSGEQLQKNNVLKTQRESLAQDVAANTLITEEVQIDSQSHKIPVKSESQKLFQDAGSVLNQGKYLGQFANCYLFIESSSGEKSKDLYIVDQHAFHERILFEELMKDFQSQKIISQELMIPIIIPLNDEIISLIQSKIDTIKELGFKVEILDKAQLALHSYPSFLQSRQVSSVFDDMIARIIAVSDSVLSEPHPLALKGKEFKKEQAQELNSHSLHSKDLYHLFFATMACHSAVRAGDPLNEELVRRLIARSKDVDFFCHCPHGRPVIRRMSEREVGSWFQRI